MAASRRPAYHRFRSRRRTGTSPAGGPALLVKKHFERFARIPSPHCPTKSHSFSDSVDAPRQQVRARVFISVFANLSRALLGNQSDQMCVIKRRDERESIWHI